MVIITLVLRGVRNAHKQTIDNRITGNDIHIITSTTSSELHIFSLFINVYDIYE